MPFNWVNFWPAPFWTVSTERVVACVRPTADRWCGGHAPCPLYGLGPIRIDELRIVDDLESRFDTGRMIPGPDHSGLFDDRIGLRQRFALGAGRKRPGVGNAAAEAVRAVCPVVEGAAEAGIYGLGCRA